MRWAGRSDENPTFAKRPAEAYHVRSPMGSKASGTTMRNQNCDQNVSSSHHIVFSCEKTIWCDDERMLVDMQSVMIGDGVGGHTWAGC